MQRQHQQQRPPSLTLPHGVGFVAVAGAAVVVGRVACICSCCSVHQGSTNSHTPYSSVPQKNKTDGCSTMSMHRPSTIDKRQHHTPPPLTPPQAVGVAGVAGAAAAVGRVACTHCYCNVRQGSTNCHTPHHPVHNTAAASHSQCTPAQDDTL